MTDIHEIKGGLDSSDLSTRWKAARELQEKLRIGSTKDREAIFLIKAAVSRLEVDIGHPMRASDPDTHARIIENCIYAIGHAIAAGVNVDHVNGLFEILKRLETDPHPWVQEAARYTLEKQRNRERELMERTDGRAKEKQAGPGPANAVVASKWDLERLERIRGGRVTPTAPIRAVAKAR